MDSKDPSSEGADGRRQARGDLLALTAFFLVSAAYLWCTYTLVNDHFDRISRARQIVVFGEVPFRDFLDPGYFLTLYASAAMLRLFDGALLGEVTLNIAAMSAGYAMAFSLAARASGSRWLALAAVATALVVTPRAYDYDKVLFYAWGLFALWRYIDRPSRRGLAHLGAVIALGGLFRYDTAVYLGGAAVAGLATRHWGQWRTLFGRLPLLTGVIAGVASPFLLFIHFHSGISAAVDQIVSYAQREGARSELFRLRPLRLEPGTSLASVITVPVNAATILSYAAWALPVAALLMLLVRRHSIGVVERAHAVSAIVLVALIALFVVRDPVIARIGAVMPVLVVLLALALGHACRRGNADRAYPAVSVLVRVPVAAAVVLLALVTMTAAASMRQKAELGFLSWWRVAELRRVPPATGINDRLRPLAEYVRACTRPSDRVLATWFVPELYFHGERGFAGGLPVLFGDHWSEDRFERHILQRLDTESVPLVIMRFGPRWIDVDYVREIWPFVADHLTRRYEVGATTDFGVNDSIYQIWVRRGMPSPSRYGQAALPCFADVPSPSKHAADARRSPVGGAASTR